MTKQVFYRTVYGRRNTFQIAILNFLQGLSSLPRLMLEVFIRKNFGERYFKFSAALWAAFLFALIPIFSFAISDFINAKFGRYEASSDRFWQNNTTYYLFLLAFLYISYKRWQEVKRNPSVYDFEKFSRYAGDINPWFYQIRIFGRFADPRRIEIFYEPALFLIIGLILWLFGQNLGVLLVVCSIFYHISYANTYREGDDFIADEIDKRLVNRSFEEIFIHGGLSKSGVQFRGRRPTSEEMRQEVYENLKEDMEEASEVH
jgi:hypothetical protein